MATETARFELINPYQKYGLKRRPTFNEILGLLSEDQKLLRPFPDRTVTQFRNSPQGSFFDGSDHVELLKEQQNRILDRQMREMILRKNAQQNRGTFHVDRHNDRSVSEQSVSDSGMMTPMGSTSSEIIYHADAQRELEERARGLAQRQQEVGERHQQAVSRLNDTLTNNMLNRGFTGLLGMPELEEVPQQTEGEPSEEELIPAEDENEGLTIYERGVFNFDNDLEKILADDTIKVDGLLFQLFYRNQLEKKDIENIKSAPDEKKQKEYLVSIIKWMIEHDAWETMANSQQLTKKIKEWKQIKKELQQQNQPASSSSGIIGCLVSGAKSLGGSVLEAGKEAGKEVAKEVAVRSAQSALGI